METINPDHKTKELPEPQSSEKYTVGETLYRCGQYKHDSDEIVLVPFIVSKITPHGIWIKPGSSSPADEWGQRFMKATAKVPYAHKTKDEAITAFSRRAYKHSKRLHKTAQAFARISCAAIRANIEQMPVLERNEYYFHVQLDHDLSD